MIDDWIGALGPQLAHVTAVSNVPGILRYGLLPAAELARRAGHDPELLVLRDKRVPLRSDGVDALLNHQKPILQGRAAADRILDGHDAASWASQLDERVFFWPMKQSMRFGDSVKRDVPIAILWFDTEKLVTCLFDRLAASPINSGNFTQGGAHAPRGDWIYVPLCAGVKAFQQNRQIRGLSSRNDRVREVSMIGAADPQQVSQMLVSINPPGAQLPGDLELS